MKTEFRRTNRGLELVLQAVNGTERTLLSELMLERRIHPGHAVLVVSPTMEGETVLTARISAVNYLNKHVLKQFGFKHGSGPFSYKQIGTKILFLFGAGSFIVWELSYTQELENLFNKARLNAYTKKELVVENRVSGVAYYFQKADAKAVIKTTDELCSLLSKLQMSTKSKIQK
ncbi:MAG: hypothetical protein LBN11_07590 [Tannerella sp.]|jgi:hypothetical protein|nr:hypothetical protein [Tannerella sp.]